MKKAIFLAFAMAFALLAVPARAAKPTDNGFDEFGYNRTARIFNGTGASWALEQGLPANYLGIYSNDKLVMKWNEAWDKCNEAGNYDESACAGAWNSNEWNGKVGGSGEVWHYKTIWVGPLGKESPYWVDGGYLLWGPYEAIMDQGSSSDSEHIWYAHGINTGYGN